MIDNLMRFPFSCLSAFISLAQSFYAFDLVIHPSKQTTNATRQARPALKERSKIAIRTNYHNASESMPPIIRGLNPPLTQNCWAPSSPSGSEDASSPNRAWGLSLSTEVQKSINRIRQLVRGSLTGVGTFLHLFI